jgi:hypothetical protein
MIVQYPVRLTGAQEPQARAQPRCCGRLLVEHLDEDGFYCPCCGTFYAVDEVQETVTLAQKALDLLASVL